GLESATIPSDHVKDPERTISKVTILGTILVSCIYILSTAAIMGIISPGKLAISTAPFADAAEQIWGRWAGYAIAAGALVACLGALNGWILLQGQLPLAASRDGVFPPVFGKLSGRNMPGQGLLISSLLASVLIVLNYARGLVHMFTFIIMLAILSTLIPYVFSSLVDLVLYFKRNRMRDVRKVLAYFSIPVPALLFSLWAIWGLGPETIIWGIILLAVGIPFFYIFRVRRKQ
ncbi:MAG: amino acid permease, partial [Bacteroidales bacterium]